MILGESELKAICDWGVLDSGVKQIDLDWLKTQLALKMVHHIKVDLLSDSRTGLSNYDAYFVYHEEPVSGENIGSLVYISALTRFFAISNATLTVKRDVVFHPFMKPEDIVENFQNSEHNECLASLLVEKGLIPLTKKNANHILPEGCIPYEYCFCDEPWNTAFHALFTNTD